MEGKGRNTHDVLDACQLARIEYVHGGFFCQHLYAAECLLRAPSTDTVRVVVERDEDVEVMRPAGRTYVQVKKRADALQPAEVADAMSRFASIRVEHAAGKTKWHRRLRHREQRAALA